MIPTISVGLGNRPAAFFKPSNLRLTPMRILPLLPVGALMLGFVGFGRIPSTAATVCRGPDAFATSQVNHLKFLMRTNDDVYVSFRQRIHLPAVADSAVQLVTDSATCAHALVVWNTPDSTNAPVLDSLYVIRVGPSYDIISPAGQGSEWNQHMVVDSLFNHVSDYLY
jgi:hypothetical protein